MKKILFFLLLLPVFAHAQMITTFVSADTPGFSGDGGQASAARFSDIRGLTVDRMGNVFVADCGNHRVRKIAPNGIVTTVAGDGTSTGYAWSGAAATSSPLWWPTHLSTDSVGNLYMYDSGIFVVYEVDTSGIIIQRVGNGSFGYTGDYFSSTSASIVAGGLATDDTGNIYISQSSNGRVRKSIGYIFPVAGNNTAGYGGDGGPALAAQLDHPTFMCADRRGNLLISDSYNHLVRNSDTADIIRSIAGQPLWSGFAGDGGPATSARLNSPAGVTKDQYGNIYICDRGNNRIRKIDIYGIIRTICGDGMPAYSGDNGLAINAQINSPEAICVDAAQNIYFVDRDNRRVRKINGINGGRMVLCTGMTDTFRSAATGGTWSVSDTAVMAISPTTGIATALTAGTVTVTYTKSGVIATVPVLVNLTPGAIAGPASVCAGVPDTLTSSPAAGVWSSSSSAVASVDAATGIVTGVLGGNVVITYTLPSGCKTTVPVTVVPQANAGTITGPDSVCIGEVTRLIDLSAGGVWVSANTAVATITTIGFITGVSPGTTTISYTLTNMCGADTAYFTVNVRTECHLGMTGVAVGNATTIYPDPATSTVTIAGDEKMERLVIYNLLGQEIYNSMPYANSTTVDVSALPGGMYYVLVNGRKAGKFVKQ